MNSIQSAFRVIDSRRAHAWLLGFATARCISDSFWLNGYHTQLWWIPVVISTVIYVYTLYLVIPGLQSLIVQYVFRRRMDLPGMLRASVLVWAVYPAVSVISLIVGLQPNQTVGWFRNVPTLMVERNFLPPGMVAVIPVLILAYTLILVRHSDAGWIRSAFAVLASLLVVYLTYYQYTWRVFFFLMDRLGLLSAIGFATLTYLVPLIPLTTAFQLAFGGDRLLPRRLIMGFSVLCFAAIAYDAFESLTRRGPGLSFAATPALPSARSNRTPRKAWTLRLYQLYDDSLRLRAYGFLDETNTAAGPRFGFFYGNQVLSDPSLLAYSQNEISYGDVLGVRTSPDTDSLMLRFNKSGATGDPFLESFEGYNAILPCDAVLEGRPVQCVMQEERASAAATQITMWTAETYLALDGGPDFSAIVLAFDSYIDGTLSMGGERHQIVGVNRRAGEIDVVFEGGTMSADCRLLASYNMYGNQPGSPTQSPVECQVGLRVDGDNRTLSGVHGLMEWIGQSQGN